MKQLFFFLIGLAWSAVLFAQSSTPGQFLFIFDASGSMWQKIDQDYKINVARSVMNTVLADIPPDARVGLMVYGHRRKNDCADIETLIPLGPLNPALFSAKLQQIDPKGMTPIAQSITAALELLRPVSGQVTVILISDGLETCSGDACALMRAAKAQGVNIALHVVGFGLKNDDQSSLECLAQAGGGQYFPANNVDELANALEQTVEPPVQGGGWLSIKASVDGKLLDIGFKIFKAGDAKEYAFGRTYTNPETNPRILLLPVGTYRAQVEAISLDGRPQQQFTDLVITPDDTLVLNVDFIMGDMEVLATRNGARSDATIRVLKAGSGEVVALGRTYNSPAQNPEKFRLLPGKYDLEITALEIKGRPVIRYENQTLAPGGSLAFKAEFPSGELQVGARQGTDLVDAVISINSVKSGKNIASGRTYLSAQSNPHSFTLEPGDYDVQLNPVKPKGLGKKSLRVSITAEKTTSVSVDW
ncbi:MAG: VWA domain-containing protein [Saprospirales bacterium]|nr:VWA domain-containing protein [Saprospirales bacterium]MBK8923226.1 VWA domain-containing protein [Saprospirales bacterium]